MLVVGSLKSRKKITFTLPTISDMGKKNAMHSLLSIFWYESSLQYLERGEEAKMGRKPGNSTVSQSVGIWALMLLTAGEDITTRGKTPAQESAKWRTTGTNKNITAGRKLIIMDISWMQMCTSTHRATRTIGRVGKFMHASLLLHSSFF